MGTASGHRSPQATSRTHPTANSRASSHSRSVSTRFTLHTRLQSRMYVPQRTPLYTSVGALRPLSGPLSNTGLLSVPAHYRYYRAYSAPYPVRYTHSHSYSHYPAYPVPRSPHSPHSPPPPSPPPAVQYADQQPYIGTFPTPGPHPVPLEVDVPLEKSKNKKTLRINFNFGFKKPNVTYSD